MWPEVGQGGGRRTQDWLRCFLVFFNLLHLREHLHGDEPFFSQWILDYGGNLPQALQKRHNTTDC